jgi:shikimate kinase
VVLIGAMAAGKTSIGEALAAHLGRPFIDSDRQIEQRTGSSGSVIAAGEGVARLHDLEWEALREALRAEEPAVIAAAASVIERPEIEEALNGASVIWLHADAVTRSTRRTTSNHRRELGPEELEKVARREPRYEAVADIVVDTTNLEVDEAVILIGDSLSTAGTDG